MSIAPGNISKLSDHMRRTEEDLKLLGGISSGQEDALALLYDEYAPMSLALAMKMMRSISDAEEIVQEVYQDLWRNASAAEGAAYTWIVWNIRERALTRLRARGHRKQHHPFDPGNVALVPEQAGRSGGAPAEVIAALSTVGREEQQVLALAFYDGFTESEIAALVRRPSATVRTELSAGLSALHLAGPWHAAAAPAHEGFPAGCYASRALMALDAEDAGRYATHLASPCDRCLLHLRSLKHSAALLPMVLAPIAPPPDLKERILFSIRLSRVAEADLAASEEPAAPAPAAEAPRKESPPAETREEERKDGTRSPWLMIAGVFVSLLILVGMAAYVNTLIEKVGGQYTFIQGQELRLATLKAELHSKRSIAAVLESPRLVLVGLEGLSSARESRGNLFWDAESDRAVLQVSRLPELPDEMEYRLWVVLKDKSVLRSALTTVSGPDSLKTYLTVIRMPEEERVRADFVTVVRVRRSDGPDAPGEICLHGDVPQIPPGQRTK